MTIIFSIIANTAEAAPSISGVSGTAVAESTITISGSGFSTRGDFGGSSPHMNVIFDDFESGSLFSRGFQMDGACNNDWDLQTSSVNKVNSTYYANRFQFDNESCPMYVSINSTQVYVKYQQHLFTDDQGGKIFRTGPATGSHEKDIWQATGGDNECTRGFSECTNCSPAPATVFCGAFNNPTNVWSDFEAWHTETGGEVSVWIDGQRSYTRKTSCGGLSKCSDQEWVNTGPAFNEAGIGNLKDDPAIRSPFEPDIGWPFDDVYVDLTQARVVISTSSTWSQRGRTYPLPPITWADGEITALFNQAHFVTDNTVYLYVVTDLGTTDSDDVNSTGFELTIGGAGGGGQTGNIPVQGLGKIQGIGKVRVQ